MLHLGDITKINGADVPPVNVVIGGSPCQDLSVAGNRAGLSGERSGLFIEQLRIIKEMRRKDIENGAVITRPRYMVWENVPGAFSSNKGEDFRIVLEETAKVVEPTATIPRPEKGKWANSGAVMGDGWSIAWRVFDAQFWGVPQRRRRIALVADFGGESAPEILFERKGLSGDSKESGTAWEDFATVVAKRFNSADRKSTGAGIAYSFDSLSSNSMKSNNPNSGCRKINISKTLDTTIPDPSKNQGGICILNDQGGSVMGVKQNADKSPTLRAETHGHVPTVYDARGNGEGGTVPTITGDHESRVTDYTALRIRERCGCEGGGKGCLIQNERSGTLAVNNDQFTVCIGNGQADQLKPSEKAGTLNCMHDQQAILISTKGNDNAETRNQILRLLQETYGEKTIFKWGIAILERLQQTDILQQGVHESGIQSETENRQKLDDSALPCPSVVTEWLLRDMQQREECGCSPQGRKSTEQRFEQSDESMPELSQQNSQTCKDLFDMWEKGEGLGLLRQTLSEIQEVWQSFNGKGQSVHGCSIVRRLTPLEAERLQGFPDGWTDIGDYIDTKGKKRKTSDSARYKALGNSIALPSWVWVLERLARCCGSDYTMASLFDGIGGFPLIWETLNGQGTCLWASEIEEFPIAVTKRHFS